MERATMLHGSSGIGQVRVFWDEIPVDLFFTNHPFHEHAAANAERRAVRRA